MSSAPTVRMMDRTTPPHIITLVCIAGIGALNMSILLPSLSQMTAYFETDYAIMQLSVSAYFAVTAVLQIVIGPISDKIGRRPVVLAALGFFVLASIGAMFATSVEMFLTFRLLQGVIVSGMVMSRAIVRDMVPQEEAASMIGYVTMGMSLVPMFGPMIGGVLQQVFDWHAVLAFVALAGIATFYLCYKDLGETVQGEGMSFGEQLRTYPELFASPRFWGYVGCASFASGAFFAYLGGASFVAGDVYGLSPFWTGIALGAPAVGYGLGNFLSGRYSTTFGINKMIYWGTLVSAGGMAVSLGLSLLNIANGPWWFFGFSSLLGLGNGLTMANAMAGMLSVRPHLAGTASGLGGSIMIAGGAALSAIAGAMLSLETGALPLQIIMFLTSVASIGAIVFVIRRERGIIV